ncbi:MAG: phytanoyl-CoA dioxygenase family protein, partial [Acidimicrobiales bacterium]|nr:phytanoyl-CoA dioxygenase family protein [Acidimicrobiales bacterium]
DHALQEELLEVGYVSVPLLDPDELAAFRAEVEAMEPDDGFAPTGEGPFNYSTYHCTFLDTNAAYKRQANEAIRRVFQPHIDRYVVDYRILTSNLYVKPPGRGRFQIHQNWPTLEDLSITTLTVWCPLQHCTAENATLHMVPGSHKLTPDVATPAEPPFFSSFEDELVEQYLVPVEVEAGHALIFDDSLVHWSPDNQGDAPRWAVQIETLPVEAEPVLYHLDTTGSEARWELFSVDFDFYVDRSIAEVIGRPTELTSLGHRPNRNRQMTVEDFAGLLAEGPTIRQEVYRTGSWTPTTVLGS